MKRRVLVSAILLLTLVFSSVPAKAEPPLLFGEWKGLVYKDWVWSPGFGQVTSQGKAFRNFSQVTSVPTVNQVFFRSLGAEFWTSDYWQNYYTPEQYYQMKVADEIPNVIAKDLKNWPTLEVMMLNGLPWQQTEWKDDYLNGLIAIYPEWRDRLTEFYSDTSNNGYAYWVFFKDMTVEQARQSHPIESATVQSPKYYLYRTFDDYAQDGGAWTDTARGTIKCPMTDFLASYAIPLPQQRDFAIVLYLDDPKIYVTEGSKINPQTLDVAPYCPRGSTLVPVRGVFEALGGTVEWVNETRQIIITKGDTKIVLKVGSKLAMVDGRSATLLEPAQLRGDRTMIPLRFISEVLGYKVEWFGDARKIIITLP